MQNSIKLAKLLTSFALAMTVSSGAWAQHGGGGHGGSSGGGGHAGGGGSGGHPSGGSSGAGGGKSGGGKSGGGQRGGGGHQPGGGGHAGGGTGGGQRGGGKSGGGQHAGGHGGGVPQGYNNVGHGEFKGSKSVTHAGHVYTQRTYANHRGNVRLLYEHRGWGHSHYYCYHHWVGFNPWFWGWYYGPWVVWEYPWGWFGDPWYHNYWYWYFHPYPRYASPGEWVTDAVLADMLRDAYDRGVAEGETQVSTATPDPISDPDKQQLLAQTNDLAKSYQGEMTIDLKDALANPNYLFAVNQTFNEMVVNSTQVCKLAEGDLLKVAVAPTEQTPVAVMAVTSSKFGSCAAGTQVRVSVSDLQEMLNTFAERVDNKLHEFEKTKNNKELFVKQP